MDGMSGILLGALLFVIAYLIYERMETQKKDNDPELAPKKAKSNEPLNLENKYKRRMLLTKTEYSFYGILKKKCDAASLLICPKVRLEDFVEVISKEKMKYRGYIKSRHVDFLICDSKLRVLAALKLDDTSHNSAKAQASDNFKNDLYKTIHMPLFRIKTNDNYDSKIDEMIQKITKQENT